MVIFYNWQNIDNQQLIISIEIIKSVYIFNTTF